MQVVICYQLLINRGHLSIRRILTAAVLNVFCVSSINKVVFLALTLQRNVCDWAVTSSSVKR